ncbi:uridine kinase family-domain-containing protein [Lipomyces japonicus]|uniref:uridine kinase family-domain-containing protein n=1 Tax=Lipomyces japonicus TaxID=56871 RepID=UPI0034CD5FE0
MAHASESSKSLASLFSVGYLPPWHRPHIIGIAGSSGSGKTSVASQIIRTLNVPWAVILSFDNFYLPLNPEQRKKAFANEYDFDAPEALDFDLLVQVLHGLRAGKKVEVPVYSFADHNRTSKTIKIYGANVIILEGIFTLYDSRITDLLDLKVFVDTDLDICMARRFRRDIIYRGRELEGAMKQWFSFVKPNFNKYVRPAIEHADVLLPRGLDNTVAIDMLIKHVQRTLAFKSLEHLKYLDGLHRPDSQKLDVEENTPDITRLDNVKILQQTAQVLSMHTILLDRGSSRDDFIFYFERLMALLIETAMNFVSYRTTTITTASGYKYTGLKPEMDTCAVSILRAGACFETSLRRILPETAIGKILIQSSSNTGEPFLHYLNIPPDIAKRFVLLVDAQATTGSAAIMAIRVLVDHGVLPTNICFVTYLADKNIAIKRILAAFPQVKIVVGKEDDEIKQRFIDTRYFGA